MTSILSIIERGKRRDHVAHDLSFESDGDVLELHDYEIVLEPEPQQFRADEFHAVLNRHRLAHTKVRYRQLTSGAT